MADLYPNYAALAAARDEGVDYRILLRQPPGSRLAHVAIHGGGIEPGTTEIADYLAGASRYYSLDSLLAQDVQDLHLSSVTFDEPQALELVAASDYVISWHGATGSEPVTRIGGLDTDLAGLIGDALTRAGFTVEFTGQETGHDTIDSLTNRGARAMGVQVELTRSLMESFFEDFTRGGRDAQPRTTAFYTYMLAVSTALAGLDIPSQPVDLNWRRARGPVAQPAQSGSSAPGDFGVPVLAPLSVDGMPLDAVKNALRLDAQRQPSEARERFWSSPPRPNGDRVREVFEFSLTAERPVNRLAFALARFPQRAWVQWRGLDGIWRPLQTARTQTPVQISIVDSLPAVIPAGVPDDVRLHPQHFGTGHWMPQLVDVVPVTASRFRIIMTRLPSSAAPRGADGQPVAYSLGVKDAAVSYRAASPADLPYLPQADPEYSVPITGSQDILGSQVDYLIRRNRAANLLPPARGVWRCAPQPVPQAVVNLYLDLRTASGDPQVVDRLLVDPLTSGPTVNLYYSTDDGQAARFAPADTPLSMPLVRPASAAPVADADGLLIDEPRSYLDVDNRGIQFDPAEPFLLAMLVRPQFTAADQRLFTVLDTGDLTVQVQAGVVQVRLGERQVDLEQVEFGVNSALLIAVAYDGQVLTVRAPWDTGRQYGTTVRAEQPPSVLRLGGPLLGEGGSIRFESLILAKGRPEDIDTIESYWADPSGYVLTPGYGADAAKHTCANAILRFDTSLITPGVDSVCPWGLVGGPGVNHAALRWTPINGDFVLKKGLWKFRPVKARHIKMEFSNLQPLPHTPSQADPLVTVQLFPADTGQGSTTVATPAQSASGAAPPGAAVATEQGGGPYTYLDSLRIGDGGPGSAPYLPTEALYAPDPLDAQALRRSGQHFPYMPLPGSRRPRWTSTGVHRYQTLQVAMDTKIGYTVAVREVLAYLSDPVAERDTEQYIDLFHDTAYLSGYADGDPGGWWHSGEAMIVKGDPPWTGVTMTSKTFVSRRRVLGVQFAAQTSAPQALNADPDFDHPSLRHWRPVGDASIASSDRYTAVIGRMAEVVRGHALSSWGALEAQFATWGAIEESNPLPYRPLWSEVENATSEADMGGVESLHPVTPPPGGRLYAAARVYTEAALADPLRLQLINGDGRILAEAEQAVDAAQVAEWYVSANLHAPLPDGQPTWENIADNGDGGTRTWDEIEALGTWGDLVQHWDVDRVYDVRVRVIQQGAAGTGRWLVDTLTIYADPLIWEITRDGGTTWYEMAGIKNNPRGVFHFPDLPAEDRTNGTQLAWRATGYAPDVSVSSMVLRPWYATLDGGAVPYQDTLQAAGAATSLADYYPPVDQDPFFQGWTLPIPQDWWLATRQWLAQNHPPTPPPPPITLPEAVAAGTDEGAPPSPVRHVMSDSIVYNR